MYPDTDTQPIAVSDELVTEVENHLPERPWDRADRYERLGLSPPAASRLAGAPWAKLFDELAPSQPLVARRLAAVDAFAADRARSPARYVAAALPHLPFADDRFRLVLSSHLMFVYPDHLGYSDHLAFARELARVAGEEARIFPLVDTLGARWPSLDRLRDDLAREGVGTDVRPVPYEFIRGGDEVLVLRPS